MIVNLYGLGLTVRKSLEALYTGPYKVISHNNKYFSITTAEDVNSNISIDRLKPAVVSEIAKMPDIDKAIPAQRDPHQRTTRLWRQNNKARQKLTLEVWLLGKATIYMTIIELLTYSCTKTDSVKPGKGSDEREIKITLFS